jgi:hypothetical protein
MQKKNYWSPRGFYCFILLFNVLSMKSIAEPSTITIQSKFLGKKIKLHCFSPKGRFDSEKAILILNFTNYANDIGNAYLENAFQFERIPSFVSINCAEIENIEFGTSFDTENLSEKGEKFKNFLFQELKDSLKKHFLLADFTIAIGHSYSATYLLSIANKNNSFYDALILFAPEKMNYTVAFDSIFKKQKPFNMYLAVGSSDAPARVKYARELANVCKEKLKDNFNFTLIKEIDHTSIVINGISKAMDFIFKDYVGNRHNPNMNLADKYQKSNKKSSELLNEINAANNSSYGVPMSNTPTNISFLFGRALTPKKDSAELDYLFHYFLKKRIKANSIEFLAYNKEQLNQLTDAIDLYKKALDGYHQENATFELNMIVFPMQSTIGLARCYFKSKAYEKGIRVLDDAAQVMDDPWFTYIKVNYLLSNEYPDKDNLKMWLNQFIEKKTYSVNAMEVSEDELKEVKLKLGK